MSAKRIRNLEVLNQEGTGSVTLGRGASAPGDNAIAIGATVGEVGEGAFASGDNSIAVGPGAKAMAARSVQLGAGTNSVADSVQVGSTRVPSTAEFNALLAYVGNATRTPGDLAVSAVNAAKFKTTATATYTIDTVPKTKSATDNLTFTAAHVVEKGKFGAVLIQINGAGTVSTAVCAASQEFDTALDAIAALPAADVDKAALGYFVIEAKSGAAWTANTSNMTANSGLLAIVIVDAPAPALPARV